MWSFTMDYSIMPRDLRQTIMLQWFIRVQTKKKNNWKKWKVFKGVAEIFRWNSMKKKTSHTGLQINNTAQHMNHQKQSAMFNN